MFEQETLPRREVETKRDDAWPQRLGQIIAGLSAVGPVDDLTSAARRVDADAPSPYEADPAYARLFDACARALSRKDACHLLLVGERGVEETSVLAELARLAAAGKLPLPRERHFVQLDCRFLLPEQSAAAAGALFSCVAGEPSLVVGLRGFAALFNGDRPAASRKLLSGMLLRTRCRLIGLVSPREYEEYVADDPLLMEFFTKLEIPEPDAATASGLCGNVARAMSHEYGFAIDEDAVDAAVALSSNFIFHEQLPGKALRVLRRACDDLAYDRAQGTGECGSVNAQRVAAVVSQFSGVPVETLRGVARKCDYESSLREIVLGQDHVVREVALELGLIKAGLTDANKPASVMMFIGQTGTGKTELAKALARIYSSSKRLRTYTLGNFVESHSVAGIIGVPPGYVGHDQGGRLISDLNADPYCVFLLDEADKAHPDVLQPFLNLFDEGWVSDQRGRVARADNAIFILTTNVGQRMVSNMVKQGKSWDEITNRLTESLSQIKHSKSNRPVFSPEFLARIRRVLVFKSLSGEAMTGIARKLASELAHTWREKRCKELRIDPAVIDLVGRRAHQRNEAAQGKEGGRIVRKLLADHVETRLQQTITDQPDAYHRCASLTVEFAAPIDAAALPDDAEFPEVRVRFAADGHRPATPAAT